MLKRLAVVCFCVFLLFAPWFVGAGSFVFDAVSLAHAESGKPHQPDGMPCGEGQDRSSDHHAVGLDCCSSSCCLRGCLSVLPFLPRHEGSFEALVMAAQIFRMDLPMQAVDPPPKG